MGKMYDHYRKLTRDREKAPYVPKDVLEKKYGPAYKLVGYIPSTFVSLPSLQEPIFESGGFLFKAVSRLFKEGTREINIDRNKISKFIPIVEWAYPLVRFFDDEEVNVVDENAWSKIQNKVFSIGSTRPVPFESDDKVVFIGTEDDFIDYFHSHHFVGATEDFFAEIGAFLSACDQFKDIQSY